MSGIRGADRDDEQLERRPVHLPAAARRLAAVSLTAVAVLAAVVVALSGGRPDSAAVTVVDQAAGEVRTLLYDEPDLKTAPFDESSSERCPDPVASEYGDPRFQRIYHALTEQTARGSGDALRTALKSRGWSQLPGWSGTKLGRSHDDRRVTISVYSAPERGHFALHVHVYSVCT